MLKRELPLRDWFRGDDMASDGLLERVRVTNLNVIRVKAFEVSVTHFGGIESVFSWMRSYGDAKSRMRWDRKSFYSKVDDST